jgi:hypothetical protein
MEILRLVYDSPKVTEISDSVQYFVTLRSATSNFNDYEQGNDSGLAVRVSSGTVDSFGINRPLNLTTKVGDTFKKFSIRQNGFQQSNTLRNTPHGYYVRQELN